MDINPGRNNMNKEKLHQIIEFSIRFGLRKYKFIDVYNAFLKYQRFVS